ncbi:MAG: ABC transporter ATP-binding protein/permease [Lachnospiraceae bacterium]|nr:ABC transporter ATP-binding protein/permease [Lachnospiraceae bacterium]
MNVLKFGFKYWKRNVPLSVLMKLISVAALSCDLILPLLSAMFINHIIQSKEPEKDSFLYFLLDGRFGEVHSWQLFKSIAIIFIGLLLLKQILVYIRNVVNQKLGLNLETDLRYAAFNKLMELDSETLSKYNTGELLTTVNSDTIMFKELFCRIIPNIFDSIFVLVAAIVILAGINIYLLFIPLILMPVFVIALLKFRKKARENFIQIRSSNSEMSLTVQENVSAVRLVRSFTNEEVEKKKFDSSNEKLKGSYINQVELSARFEAIFSMIRQCAYIGSIAVGAVLVINGHLLVGYLVSCTEYVNRIMNFITMINNMFFQMQQQLVSGQKLMKFMEAKSQIPDGTEKVKETENIHISIKNASMVLDDRQMLTDISMDIPQGSRIGIVGGTGSGKSLLLESLIRVHDMTSGSIELNGKDIREYTLESLRDKFSYVFQDVFLFSNTIDSNIAFPCPAVDEDKVREAAYHAQAAGFIKKLEDGYDTIVGERGYGLSGGQKQRVSIARALLKNSPVLVLDDSTSALDVDTEKRLLADIKKHYPEKTLLISAHRMTSVADCDEIIYLMDGRIIERGNFEELMKLNGHFAAVYNAQMARSRDLVDKAQAEGV